MKKIAIISLVLILLLLTACSDMESMDIEYINSNYELLSKRNEKEILSLNGKYSIDILEHIDVCNEEGIPYPYALYLYYLTGYSIGYVFMDSQDAIEVGAYSVETKDVNKKRTLESFNTRSPILCIRKISNELLYTVHYTQGDYIYGFFKYDDESGSWISTGEIYEACKTLYKKDFNSIKEGSTLKEVLDIDPSQTQAFNYKKVCSDKFISHHILADGFLTITYEGTVDNKTKAEQLIVKSMEWSSHPILEQDLPK